MLSGKISLPTALLVAVGSMLVVFTVLLLLFLLTKLMARVLQRSAPQKEDRQAEDPDELTAVLMAAVQFYREEDRANPMVRGAPRRLTTFFASADPTIRDRAHTSERLEQEL